MSQKTRRRTFIEESAMLDQAVRLSEEQCTVAVNTKNRHSPSIFQELEKLNEVVFDLISTANRR